MKPEKVNLRIRLAGRTFFLETYPEYESMIRAAVEKLDDQFRQMRKTYEADDSELLAMLLIREVAGKEKILHECDKKEKAHQAEWDKVSEILKQIDEINKD